MRKLKSILIVTLSILAALYVLLCLFLYFKQESIIFYPNRLPQDHRFRFPVPFEEHRIKTADDVSLHGVLFRTDSAKGLVFFLHGNAGAVDGWGELAPIYTSLGYDVFMLDYRGYGKSEGKIERQQQFYADIQAAYDYWRLRYPEEKIVVVGFSIGSGGASMLAGRNNPKMLLLLAPFYSLTDMLHHTFPFVPSFLLKYKFKNHQFLQQSTAPVYIFHGTRDEVVPHASGVKLRNHLKPGDQFISLESQNHNGIHSNRHFLNTIQKLLLQPDH